MTLQCLKKGIVPSQVLLNFLFGNGIPARKISSARVLASGMPKKQMQKTAGGVDGTIFKSLPVDDDVSSMDSNSSQKRYRESKLQPHYEGMIRQNGEVAQQQQTFPATPLNYLVVPGLVVETQRCCFRCT